MFKKIALVILVPIVALLGYAASKPDDFRYERKIVINAAPEKIFPYLNDMELMLQWSPWEKIDPNMKRSYKGPQSGVGAAYAWSGNKDVGEGIAEIVESDAPNKVVTKLTFLRPFEANNMAEYTLAPTAEGTEVTWAMYGKQPYLGKVMSVVMNCEKMVSEQFDKGLADLKAIVEKK